MTDTRVTSTSSEAFLRLPWMVVLAAFGALFVVTSVALCGDGFVHAEAHRYIPHYLTARPFLDLIFDNDATEGCLRARELSHVFDYFDSQWIGWSASHGHPHFFSASHYLFHLAAGLVLWWLGSRHFGLSKGASLGLVLLLWTSPSAMLYTSFFRSAKAGVLLMVFVVALMDRVVHSRQGKAGGRAASLLFGLSLFCLFWFDEQGLFLCAVFVMLFLWKAHATGLSLDKQQGAIAAVALALSLLWRYYGSTAATGFLVHETVDASYAHLPIAEVLHQPATLLKILFSAPLLVVDAFRFPVGNLPFGLALAAVAGIYWTLKRRSEESPGHSAFKQAHLAFAAVGGLLVVMYVLMLVRADYLVSSEHRRFLYCLPSSAVWLLISAFALGVFNVLKPGNQRRIEIVLVLLVVGNVFALQEHRFILRHGYYEFGRARATQLKAMLQPDHLAAVQATEPQLREQFRAAMAKPADFSGPLEQSALYLFFLAKSKGVTL